MPGQLHESFKARLNPPEELPDHFDAELHEFITGLADTIPHRTRDRTPQGSFSRRITVEDIKKSRSNSGKSPFAAHMGSTRCVLF
jgi:hypothetical protein